MLSNKRQLIRVVLYANKKHGYKATFWLNRPKNKSKDTSLLSGTCYVIIQQPTTAAR